jgi:hypothetical protein
VTLPRERDGEVFELPGKVLVDEQDLHGASS